MATIEEIMAAQALRKAPVAPSVPNRTIQSLAQLSPQPVQSPPFRGGYVGNPAMAETLRGAPPVAAPEYRGAQAESLRSGAPAPAPVQRGAMMDRPAVAETLRGGAPVQSPPLRAAGATQPVMPPAPKPGVISAISKTPSWYNKDINTRPVTDLAKKASTATMNKAPAVLGKITSAGGKVIPALGAAIEGAQTYQDNVTPGMNGLDQTARVAEGVGRFAGGMAGMAGGATLGAMTGPLAPVAVPALSVIGGLAGASAPDLVNKAVNAVSGYFGGPSENQLPSDRAQELRNKQTPAPNSPSSTPNQAPVPAQVPPAPVTPQTGQAQASQTKPGVISNLNRQTVKKQAPAASPAATAAAPVDAQAEATEPNPMEGVKYATLDGNGPVVQMNDGRTLTGKEAGAIMLAAALYDERNPQTGPVEVIRGTTRTTAGPELGYGMELDQGTYNALAQTPDGFKGLIAGIAQGTTDKANPYDAKARGDLQQQELQNQGTERNATISAGPGYAGVAQRAASDAAELGFKRETAEKPVVVGGGQEPVYDSSGMYVGMRQVPGRLYSPKSQQWIDQPAAAPKTNIALPTGAINKLKANPSMAADFDAKYGQGSAAKYLGK